MQNRAYNGIYFVCLCAYTYEIHGWNETKEHHHIKAFVAFNFEVFDVIECLSVVVVVIDAILYPVFWIESIEQIIYTRWRLWITEAKEN